MYPWLQPRAPQTASTQRQVPLVKSCIMDNSIGLEALKQYLHCFFFCFIQMFAQYWNRLLQNKDDFWDSRSVTEYALWISLDGDPMN